MKAARGEQGNNGRACLLERGGEEAEEEEEGEEEEGEEEGEEAGGGGFRHIIWLPGSRKKGLQSVFCMTAAASVVSPFSLWSAKSRQRRQKICLHLFPLVQEEEEELPDMDGEGPS